MHSKTRIFALLLAGCIASSVGVAQDRDHDHDRARDKCEQKVRKAEQNLNNAVRKHGEHSRQAEQKRHSLQEARERCGGAMGHDRDHDHDHDHR
ncbi:MAG TPA: hypothetical protein VE783_02670 [Candidatus Limnocylindrales bacterium]|nr:hypothetical protein [Candidatus Limnocylindrales bacterium]